MELPKGSNANLKGTDTTVRICKVTISILKMLKGYRNYSSLAKYVINSVKFEPQNSGA